ncbi:hypothetical protein EGW08_010551 [Elysia chlorotica]|uniref:Pre-mRNA-splicing factor 38 n=1 Tax=Elysia chlorotica TaxID=188477 RepID=A0A433TJD4_ELYCH|nr:hypothetical protein EGW08_010551 [Elysia chlorotica]
MAPNNPLVPWGNDKTMNLNTLILTNIQSSPYFKVQLFELKTFHEVVDEIYYRVEHLEPWEKGSRKTAGQTGMCGGVRGVGAGGIVSSAYCLLFKLFTLKLTKKQLVNLITHRDSPYIRGLGFMYIRYCQAPADLWDWYEPYLDDDEELDVKAGTGHVMTIGEMLRQWLVKLEWYSTLFPRIPVPIQKDLEIKFRNRPVTYSGADQDYEDNGEPEHIPDEEVSFGEAERAAHSQRGRGAGSGGVSRDGFRNGHQRRSSPSYGRPRSPRRSPPRRHTSPRCSPPRGRDDFSRELENEKERQRRERAKEHKHSKHSKHRSQSKDRVRSRSRDRTERKLSPAHPRDRERKRSRSGSREKRRSGSRDRGHREHSSSHRRDKDSRKEEKRSKKHKHKDRERERR